MTVMNETSTFIKKMASPDPKIRDRAVRTVQSFLSTKGDSLSYDEFLKLWKGFFYCFWLSDKAEGQNSLAELISKLVHNLSVENKDAFSESSAGLFLRSFWETMGREWPHLDRLRLNKYYNLMKHVLHQSFQIIAICSETEESVSWSADLVKGHTGILVGTVLDYSNRSYPDSIRNFVIENYFELLKSCSEEGFSAELTVLVCEPIIHAVAYCENKAFFKQATESLIQGVLPGDDEDDFDNLDENVEKSENEEECSESDQSDDGNALYESDNNEMNHDISKDSDSSEIDHDVETDSEDISSCGEDEGFDSEEFDNIKDTISDDHSSEDEFLNVFDYSLLSKFIFDYGGREDVLARNRRFLFELSQIIEEVESGYEAVSSCCHEGDSCCN